MPKLVAIGDIHGQYTKLRNLIDKLEPGPGDEFVFLGDYVDSGPQSAEVIEYLIRQRKYRKWTYLMGNHDSWFLDYCQNGYSDPSWLFYGGMDTLLSYGGEGAVIPRQHVDFLQLLSRPTKIAPAMGDVEYVFSHGMLPPTRSLEGRFDHTDALWGRPTSYGLGGLAFDVEEGQWYEKEADHDPKWAWGDSQVLIFGHTPEPEPRYIFDGDHLRALGIDTGAKMDDNPLTAAILPPYRGEPIKFVQAWG